MIENSIMTELSLEPEIGDLQCNGLTTVNSLSGGKTSSYLAANYPADLELFALVCIDDPNAGKGPKPIDAKLKQMANDKLQKYCSHQNEFVATSEDPMILSTMFDLEQILGREIIWLRGMGWEQMLKYKKAIPNRDKRFCTTILKMVPIMEHLYKYTDLPVKMRVGFRYDEKEREENFTDTFMFSKQCDYRPKSNTWIHRWEEIKWRIGDFVLIKDKVTHPTIVKFWKGKNISFAEDSNCQNCFWKPEQQLRKNFDTNPSIMYWSLVQEELYERTFKDEYSLLDIKKMGLQMDFFFGTGSGCQAGFCTD
jgi:hypothetical protein